MNDIPKIVCRFQLTHPLVPPSILEGSRMKKPQFFAIFVWWPPQDSFVEVSWHLDVILQQKLVGIRRHGKPFLGRKRPFSLKFKIKSPLFTVSDAEHAFSTPKIQKLSGAKVRGMFSFWASLIAYIVYVDSKWLLFNPFESTSLSLFSTKKKTPNPIKIRSYFLSSIEYFRNFFQRFLVIVLIVYTLRPIQSDPTWSAIWFDSIFFSWRFRSDRILLRVRWDYFFTAVFLLSARWAPTVSATSCAFRI